MPTTVSTVLVPTKNAARRSAETVLPVTGPKLAASSATLAPTDAGANGTSLPPPCANATSSTAAAETGTPNAARKQASEASLQRAARELPRQHVAGVGARRAQRRAAAADAGGDPAHARHAARERDQHDSAIAPAARAATVAGEAPNCGSDPGGEGDRQQQRADGHLPRALGDERSGQQRASRLAHPAPEQQHAHGVAAARRHEPAGPGAGHPCGDRVAPAQAREHSPRRCARARTNRARAPPGWPGGARRRARASRRPRLPSPPMLPAAPKRHRAFRRSSGRWGGR